MGSLRALLHHRSAVVGLSVLLIIVVCTIFASLIAPFDPYEQSFSLRFQPPSREHLMGGDQLGRDVLTRVLYGGRISLRVGLISVAIGSITGTIVGLLGGYLGGWTDILLMRFIDTLLAFPGILLALVVIAAIGPGLDNVVIAVGVALIPPFARLTRGSVLSIREEVYVEASQAIGARKLRIMLRHVLPNAIGPIIVFTSLQLGTAILFAAGLSFLGLGAQPPTPEWGLMCSQGRKYLGLAWWPSTFPGLTLTLLVISLNLIGDALRDALDPRTRWES